MRPQNYVDPQMPGVRVSILFYSCGAAPLGGVACYFCSQGHNLLIFAISLIFGLSVKLRGCFQMESLFLLEQDFDQTCCKDHS